MASAGNDSEYWHNPAMREEYAHLLQGGPPVGEDTLPASELAEAYGISEDQAVDFTARMNTMSEEIGDTGALDMAFMGLSDTAQGVASAVLADPSKREAYINSMPVETLEELIDFVGRMPDTEVAALERALLL
jgi:hypothetical protein